MKFTVKMLRSGLRACDPESEVVFDLSGVTMRLTSLTLNTLPPPEGRVTINLEVADSLPLTGAFLK